MEQTSDEHDTLQVTAAHGPNTEAKDQHRGFTTDQHIALGIMANR